MSLDIKKIVNDGVATSFGILESLSEKINIKTRVSGDYDTDTGLTTDTFDTVEHKVIFSSVSISDGYYPLHSQMRDGDIEIGDLTILLPTKGVNMPIKTDAEITRIKDSSKWRIINLLLDPAEAMYTLHVRAAT